MRQGFDDDGAAGAIADQKDRRCVDSACGTFDIGSQLPRSGDDVAIIDMVFEITIFAVIPLKREDL